MKITEQQKRKIGEYIFIYAMLAFPILWFSTFWIYVNIESVLMAFKVYDGFGKYSWSLQNFKDMFYEFGLSDSTMSLALRNTLLFFPENMCSIGLSLFFSYFFYRKMPGYRFFRVAFYLPSIISGMITVTAFKNIIGPVGPLSQALKSWFGMSAADIPNWICDDRYAIWIVLLFTLWNSFGVNIIMFGGAMARVPQEVVESARIDGVGMGREFFQIMLPLIWPTLSTVLIFSITGIFTAQGATLILTGGQYKTQNISLFIFQSVLSSSYEYPAAIGLFYTIISMFLVFSARFVMDRINTGAEY